MRRIVYALGAVLALAALGLSAPASASVAASHHTTLHATRQVASAATGTVSVNVYVYYNPSLDGQQVELDASASTTCGSISTYSWNFGDGGATSSSSYYVYHTWITNGTTKSFTVGLTITDSCGNSVQTSFTQDVKPDLAPNLSVSFSPDSTNPLKFFADPSATTDTDGSVPNPTGPYEYYWTWGDGSHSYSYANSSNGLTSHTYTSAGTHTVNVTAYDSAYNSSQQTYTVGGTTPNLVEETNSAITYSGAWSLTGCPGSACSPDKQEKYSVTQGNSAVLHFTGTKAAWIATKGPKGGKANVYVDGVLKQTVNLYKASPYQDGVTVYSTATLPRGSHTLKIKLTLNQRVNIDAFNVTP